MNRNKLITKLIKDPKFKGRCVRLSDTPDDLLQDSFEIVCRMNPEKLLRIYHQGKIDNYIMRIIYTTYLNSREILIPVEAINYLHSEDTYDDTSDEVINKYLDIIRSGRLLNITDTERPDFAQLLFDEYLEEGSARKLAKELGLNNSTIQRILNPIIHKMNGN